MLSNYLKIAIRNLRRNPIHSALNTIGLGVGLASCLLVGLYVQGEVGHDTSHARSQRIYRAVRGFTTKGSPTTHIPAIGGSVGPQWQAAFPEVEHVVRTYFREDGGPWLKAGGRTFKQSFCVTDTTLLDVFSLPLVAGDPKTCLTESGGVLLTESMAAKFFPNSDPMGQLITIDDRKVGGEYRVTGVMKDLPGTSHIEFDFVTTMRATGWSSGFLEGRPLRTRDGRTDTFVLLRQGTDPRAVEEKIATLMAERLPPDIRDVASYHLQPIERIHLYSFEDYGFSSGGNIAHVRLFVTVALSILVLACVNYANLNTARAVRRAREVGLRKVFGAFRRQLAIQFLSESLVVAACAFLLALGLVTLLLPTFADVVGRPYTLAAPKNVLIAGLTALCVPLVGLLAGGYPAIVLSAFHPGSVLRNFHGLGSGRSLLRKGLVVFQFGVTIVLLAVTWVVYSQMKYMSEKNLGFDREHVVVTHLFRQDYDLIPKYETVKQAFMDVPGVVGASAAQLRMGQYVGYGPVGLEGDSESDVVMARSSIDRDFIGLMGMEFVAGRDLSPTGATDASRIVRGAGGTTGPAPVEVLLTETAARRLRLSDPIGKTVVLRFGDYRPTIVGVLRDFHAHSLYEKIIPGYFYRWVPSFRYLYLKVASENLPETIAGIEAVWGRLLPGKPFQFSFLDDQLDNVYRSETRAQQLFLTFTLVAVAISCAGLWSFASYASEQRRKEIGIRKVLGASSQEILGKLSREFMALVILAAAVAAPIGFWISRDWLADFAYRIDLDVQPFLFSALLASAVALATVAYESLRAAATDPIEAIQHE